MQLPKDTRQHEVFALMRRFAPALQPVRSRALLTAVLVLGTPLLSVALILLAKRITDEVMLARQLDILPGFAAAAVAVATLKLALDYSATRLEASVVEHVFQSIRTRLYRRLMTLSPGSLRGGQTGDQLARLSGDVERTEMLVFTGPLTVAADVAAIAYFSGFLFLLSWKLTLCALTALPILALASLRLAPRVRRASRVARYRSSVWMSLAEERLNAVGMVRATGAEELEVSAFAARCDAARRAELRTVAVQAWLTLVIDAAVLLGVGAVLALGAYEIATGALTAGTLVAFGGAVGSLYDPARGLARAAARFQRSAAGAQRVADLLDTPSLVTEPALPRPIGKIRGQLEFRSVHFSHEGAPVLNGVTLTIRPGETVALVGPSGAGKSTLASLAMRLHDPDSGAILLDGIDLRELSFKTLRQAFAAVFQDPFVFRGSIADNIRYGLDVRDDDVVRAARMAHLEPFVAARAGGYLAQTGPRGSRLSAGQRQRVALARAFLRRAPLLILDEATASIDSETEELIQDSLARASGRRTTLIIAHRLSSVRRADRVAVLEGGRIVEMGTPNEVLFGGSRCHELFAAQVQRAEAA
jgi:ABC-type multidrug transport system fused ATPase/permease subunit